MGRRKGRGGLRRLVGRLAGGTLASALLGGCGLGPQALTIPVAPSAGFAYLQLAHERGFDRAEGLTLALDQRADPQEIVHAWLRGELAIAPLSTVELLEICCRLPRRCPVVVMVLDESRGANKLLVHRSIPTLRALRGRRVGLATSSLGPYLLSRAMASVGADIADVTIVPIAPESMGSALNNRRVEAVVSFSPFSELVERLGIARVLFDSRSMPGEIVEVLVVEPSFLAANGEAVAKLLRSWQRAQSWARSNPAEARTALARQLKLSESAVARLEEELAYLPLTRQLEMLRPGGAISAHLLAVQGVQRNLGTVRPDAPLPAVSDALVRRALQGARAAQPGRPSASIASAPK